MSETATIKVNWVSTRGGGFTAYASEDKGGYKKGEMISKVGFQMIKFPEQLCILVKRPS